MKHLDKIENIIPELINDMSDIVFFIADINKENPHHVYLSNGFEQMLGYPKENSLNNFNFFYDIVHPEDTEKVKNEIVGSNYKKTIIFRIKKADGKYIKCVSHNYSKKIDDKEYAYGTMTRIG
jgi:PAS domain-containing protein